ncbi:hypothetical protein BTO30_06995 [Domibacillus antri]|uniref:GNAT family N-acetyltransferase n=1 Tax=Domibacillus antri TaxID=1714264 RepID=A0A1Q8Q6L5_9BACI|nr:hypothetical protein [Domibacillus antri]OLN22935.1 hypothetical protein BTO30_06995 [Domibacillus antri]
MPAHLVRTDQDFKRYTDIWLPIWIERGYELESYTIPGINRYIFFDIYGDYGSVEIIPYQFKKSPINDNFPFNRYLFLKDMKTAEVDKLAIKKDVQSVKKLHEIMSFLTNYFIYSGFDCYIALLNPQVYEAFIWRFKIPITKLSIPDFETPYVPVLFKVEELKKSLYYERMKRKALKMW